MSQIRFGGFETIPLVVKNLLIINGLFFLATIGLSEYINLNDYLALHYYKSPDFMPHQFISHMFMHGGMTHILLNMFVLWMFGANMENIWGPKKFLTFYMIAGLGSGIIQMLFMQIQYMSYASELDAQTIDIVLREGTELIKSGRNWTDPNMGGLNSVLNTTVVGASGAVYGLLLAFGMTFPESLLFIFGLFPVKAKWAVTGFIVIELFSGIQNNPTDNVAHFAHLGGMLFGFLVIKYWQFKQKKKFY